MTRVDAQTQLRPVPYPGTDVTSVGYTFARQCPRLPDEMPSPSYEISGPPDAPLIVALGGISGTRHVTATDEDASPGWWQSVVGRHAAIDTTEYRVLGLDYRDGGAGITGYPARSVSTHDQADALAAVLDVLAIRRVHAVVGASYGGMVALAFAERYAMRTTRVVTVSGAHAPHPMSTALRAIQRRIVKLGIETGRTRDSLALARALAMTTYRSAREFAERFGHDAQTTTDNGDAVFPVESYLLHHGEKFAEQWSASRFLALSLSADLHRVDPRRIRTPVALIAIKGDTVVPPAQMGQLAHDLAGPCDLTVLDAVTGHDAFLAEPDIIGPAIRNALTTQSIS